MRGRIARKNEPIGRGLLLLLSAFLLAAVVSMGLLAARPAAAAEEGTWNWLTVTEPGDTATPSYSNGLSDDGQVIVTTVDASAPGESYGANTQHEIRVSRDGGATWTSTPLPLGQIVTRVSVSPDGQRVGVYGMSASGGTWMLLSTDSGVTFAPTTGTLPTDTASPSMTNFFVRSGEIFLTPIRYEFDGTTFTYFVDVYVSTDNGATWTLHATRSYDVYSAVVSLNVSANGQRFITGGTAGVSHSADGGTSWSDIPLASIDPVLDPATAMFYGAAISDDGQNLMATYWPMTGAGYGEAATYISRDAGATWQKHTSTLALAIYGNASVSRDFRTILALDTTDYDGSSSATMSLVITRDGGATWERLDDYVTFDNSGSGIPTLSGDGRTIFIADRNGDGGTLRLIAGRWTPVAVIDDNTTDEQPGSSQDGAAPSAPDTGANRAATPVPMLLGGTALILALIFIRAIRPRV